MTEMMDRDMDCIGTDGPTPNTAQDEHDVGAYNDRAQGAEVAPQAATKNGKASKGDHRKGTPMLPVVAGDGLQIESDGGATRADGTLRLLSLWGAASTARYLSAQLSTGKRLDVQAAPPLGPWEPLWGSKDGGYKRLRRGVSARLSHTLVLGREYDATRLDVGERTFVVTLRRDRLDQTAETVYTAFLIALLDEPVDPAWAAWLWRRARQGRGPAAHGVGSGAARGVGVRRAGDAARRHLGRAGGRLPLRRVVHPRRRPGRLT